MLESPHCRLLMKIEKEGNQGCILRASPNLISGADGGRRRPGLQGQPQGGDIIAEGGVAEKKNRSEERFEMMLRPRVPG